MRSIVLPIAWCGLVIALGVAGMLHRRGGEFGWDAAGWASLILVGVAYPIPAFVAFARAHRDTVKIALLDLLLGWTGIAWLVALGWSLAPRAPAPPPRADVGS